MLLTLGRFQLNVKIWPFLLFLSSLCLLLALGQWQLQRAEYKNTRQVQLDQAAQVQASQLTAEYLKEQAEESYLDKPILISGSVNLDNIWFVENKIMNHQLGVECIVAIKLDHNSTLSSEKAEYVLVNLGWLPVDKNRIPAFSTQDLPLNVTKLNARITKPNHNLFMSEEIHQRLGYKFIQQVNLEQISKHAKIDLLPILAVVDKKSLMAFQPNWQPIVMPAQKHYGYAVQWFGLALALCIIIIIKAVKWKKPIN